MEIATFDHKGEFSHLAMESIILHSRKTFKSKIIPISNSLSFRFITPKTTTCQVRPLQLIRAY